MKQTYDSLSLVAGANLKRLIEEAHMTQDDAAEKLHLSEASCIRRLYRNGITKIDEIQRIADILEVDSSEMFKPID